MGPILVVSGLSGVGTGLSLLILPLLLLYNGLLVGLGPIEHVVVILWTPPAGMELLQCALE